MKKIIYILIKFDIDTCGNYAPWIEQFAYNNDGDYINDNIIINTNDPENDDIKEYIIRYTF